MEYKLSEQELKDLMHRSWLQSKKFYSGKTDEYFYEFFEAETKQLILYGVVFKEAEESEKIDNKEPLPLWKEYYKGAINSEVELCECGGNKRVGLDCTMKPCKHPYYKK